MKLIPNAVLGTAWNIIALFVIWSIAPRKVFEKRSSFPFNDPLSGAGDGVLLHMVSWWEP